MGPLLASKRLRPGEVLNCFLPRRQAAIGGVPPAISGACGRAAGADAALLELLGDRGCPVVDRLPVAVVALAAWAMRTDAFSAKPSLLRSSFPATA